MTLKNKPPKSLPAAIDLLSAVVEAVDGRVPIIMDSGIRRDTDVFKALALGADAVALGRPILYSLALGGSKRVESVYARTLRKISAELSALRVVFAKYKARRERNIKAEAKSMSRDR